MCFIIALGSGCSGGDSEVQVAETSAPGSDPARWIAYCEASYDTGAGNAMASDRSSWIEDCANECASPTWEQACRNNALKLGVSVPK